MKKSIIRIFKEIFEFTRIKSALCSAFIVIPFFCPQEEGLVSRKYIREVLNKECPWNDSHGVADDFLGAGWNNYNARYIRL